MKKDMSALLENMTRLRLKRFRLSIDDFAAWNASLSELREIPFNELKIAPGFVHHASADNEVSAKYDACLGMARQLNMEVVAEGVEDLDDWNFIRRTGCEFAQGYFIAQPMPASDLPDWKTGWQKRWSSGLSDDTTRSR